MAEQTLVIIKPDGLSRRLVGRIIQRFEDKQLQISSIKKETLTQTQLREHYHQLVEQPFFPRLVSYMTEGPVLLLVLKGDNAVLQTRKIVGATDPMEAEMGTLRGDLGMDKTRNLIHASDSVDSAAEEITRFFG
ncbi:nucleoside-diphosphate kinase [Tetragenococcus koreensis]|uniref:Nucleoside diphosphate kinase n=1 Tax=Tetragenococcus koreensis TaxID=290335 RepID=A0AAN4RJ89_9ENTE|nr:nucleoside-diphosphate kinase [Tetragenococcus koreensis]AYW46284.1 nucleoside-diphosphate kinase [Tetragenococcus koreensis]MCF1585834.1 nucleoside-diphosphate kinase [Tetragenococcus koreensis]MCF1615416.1 nucleoside-diphosphate kinase [Tetragenococcus koreensis]MCF1617938.1 nucleoside-diphosphate kinase [Tetragenococcus koreensis]MCF1619399.1 nucleoside-diphosphate kinase [Tetragenococcus koreensis]